MLVPERAKTRNLFISEPDTEFTWVTVARTVPMVPATVFYHVLSCGVGQDIMTSRNHGWHPVLNLGIRSFSCLSILSNCSVCGRTTHGLFGK